MDGTVDDAYNILFEVKDILQSFHLEFWLDGGTLLGMVRDYTFCNGDHNDIDLSCWGTKENVDIIPTMIEKFINYGYILFNHWDWNGKAHEVSFKKDGIKVDIFFKERK